MGRYITLQPAAHTDQITADGQELTKLPYPFHVNAATGAIDRQSVFVGWEVVGFQRDVARQEINLWWDDYVASDPQRAVGMYVVTRDGQGQMSTHLTAVDKVEVVDVAV